MKRCPICMTRFSFEDFEIHMAAHGLDPWILKQRTAQAQWVVAHPGQHKPGEACTCSFYGVRNVCEVALLEAA